MSCTNCGSSSIVQDPATSERVCSDCGSVVDSNSIVSEVTFGENSAGAAVVTGTFISNDQAGASSGGKFGQHSESRALTLEKNRARINKVAQLLHIPEHIAGSAFQYYKLALAHNFVKGRKSQYVVSACLYVACRRARTTHMLMDFAEVIYVNVFQIGATYLQLVKTLGIHDIPCIDPSIFIERFTAQLSFGEEGGKKVREDANKLAQRMSRDWLVYGRRPAGIAAACILLASRMNNYRRSKTEIVQIAKIAEETVQRRLDEFKTTSAGSLTVSDFRNTQIESEADPPAFTKHRVKEAKEEEFRTLNEEKMKSGETSIGLDEDDIMITEMIKDIDKQNEVKSEQIEEGEEQTGENSKKEDKDKDKADEKRIEDEIDLTLHDPDFKAASKGWAIMKKFKLKKEEEEEKEKLSQSSAAENSKWVSEIRDDPERLSDVDDDEVDSFILNSNEVEIKSRVWMTLNRDYLIEMENKKLKMEADIKAGIYKAPRKRKRKQGGGTAGGGGDVTKEEVKNEDGSNDASPLNAAESTKKMLQTRSFSRKINYAAVDSLFRRDKK